MSSYYEKFPGGKVVCIDEEIPFEIPKGWEWARINNIAISQLGKTLDRGRESGKSYPYLCSINVYWEGIDLSKVKTFLLEDNELERYRIDKGDLLICEGGDYARCSVWDKEGVFYYQNALHRVRFFCGINPYFYKFVVEYYRMAGLIVGQGQTIKHFTYESMKQLCFPVPPLSEQNKIITFLNTITPLITQYGKSQKALDNLNAGIGSRLKASILHEAIQGRLVPQDSSDEPAEKLLEEINAEKQRLVKAGKLKAKDAISSVIFKGDDNKYYEKTGKDVVDITEEIPFETPSNWCWTRASSIAQIIMGQSPDGESINSSNGIEFHQGKVHFTDKYLAVAPYFTSAPSKYAEPLSLLLCVRAPVGVANITERRICIGRGLCALNFYKGINLDLMFYFFATFKKYYEDLATGSTFKAISKDIVSDTLIPIPPEQEQIRIIEMIQSLYSKIA